MANQRCATSSLWIRAQAEPQRQASAHSNQLGTQRVPFFVPHDGQQMAVRLHGKDLERPWYKWPVSPMPVSSIGSARHRHSESADLSGH